MNYVDPDWSIEILGLIIEILELKLLSGTEGKPPLDRVPLYINKQAGNMTVIQEIVPTHRRLAHFCVRNCKHIYKICITFLK